MRTPKHEVHENDSNPGNYLEVLERLNTFIVDNHHNMQGAFIMLTTGIDGDNPDHHKGMFFLSGDNNVLVDNLVLAIAQVPELLDLFAAAIVKGDLKKDFVTRALLLEAKQLITKKLQESLNKQPDEMRDILDPGIGPKDN